MTESQVQSQIIDYLTVRENKEELFFQRTNNTPVFDPVGKRFRAMAKGQKKGFPDLLIFKGGATIAIEVKTKTGRQSKEQKEVQEKLEKQGIRYCIVRSFDDIIRILEETE